jgi:ABC-type antimicrobial peptide transport system permease subunit
MALGTGLAVLLGRGMSSLLYGVKPMDPATLLVIVAVVIVTSVAALIAPARRALTVNPMDALREE